MQPRFVAAAIALATSFGVRAAGRTGLEVGVRTGFIVPLGDIDQGDPFSNSFSGFVPIGAEAAPARSRTRR